MRTPSRMMPPRPTVKPLAIGCNLLLAIFLISFSIVGFLSLYRNGHYLVIIISTAFFIWPFFHKNPHRSKLRKERTGENIGTFAFALPARQYDTWVVRAVYEELTIWINVPIHPDDKLIKDLKLAADDIIEVLANVTNRLNLNIDENPKRNPPFPVTVKDLIGFLCELSTIPSDYSPAPTKQPSNVNHSSDDDLDDLVVF